MYFVTIGEGDNFRTRSKTHNYVPPFISTMYKGMYTKRMNNFKTPQLKKIWELKDYESYEPQVMKREQQNQLTCYR